MSQPAEPADAGRLQPRTAWKSFRDWRRSRPFWGGITAILAAIEMYGVTAAPFHVVLIQGVAGVSAIVIAICFILLAVLTWFQPHVRVATGLMIVVLSLASILLTNLGGFLIGMLLGLHSGSSITAWRPRPAQRRKPDAAPHDGGGGGGALLSWFPGRGPHQATPETTPDTTPDTTQPARDTDASALGEPAPGESSAADDPANSDPASHDPASSDAGGRIRRGRLGGPQSYLSVALLAGLVVAPGARASTTSSDSLFCSILPLLCPASSSAQAAATPTPTASPTTSPSASPSPTAATSPGPTPSQTAAPATPAVTTSSSAQPPARSTPTSPSGAGSPAGPACDPTQLPTGRIALGSAAATRAATVVRACLAAQRAGSTTGATPTLADAQAPAAGGATRASSQPAHIVAGEESMQGLSYHGIATLDTASGQLQVLDFTASSVTIQGMREGVGPMSLRGSTVTLGGDVHLYVISLSGKVFGLLPLTISPASPPPLVLPFMVFTDVDSQIAYLDAGVLDAPGAQIAVG